MGPVTRIPPKNHVSRDATSVALPQPHNKVGDGPWTDRPKSGKGKGKKGKDKDKGKDRPQGKGKKSKDQDKDKHRPQEVPEPPEPEPERKERVPPWRPEEKVPPWRKDKGRKKEAKASPEESEDEDWGSWKAPKGATPAGSTNPPEAKPPPEVDAAPPTIITSGSSLDARVRRTNPFEFLEIAVETVEQGLVLSPADSKAAWRKMLLKLHPDKAGNTQEAQDKMVMLNSIYKHLNEPYAGSKRTSLAQAQREEA